MEPYVKTLRVVDAHFGEWIATVEVESDMSWVTLTCSKYPDKVMETSLVDNKVLQEEIMSMIAGVKEAFIQMKNYIEFYSNQGFGVAVSDNAGNFESNTYYDWKRHHAEGLYSPVTDYQLDVNPYE